MRARLRLAADRGEKVTPPMVGAMVGVTGATIGRYEADEREPNLGMIVLLAAALGVTPAYIAFGEAATVVPVLGVEPGSIAEGVTQVPRPPKAVLQSPREAGGRGAGAGGGKSGAAKRRAAGDGR